MASCTTPIRKLGDEGTKLESGEVPPQQGLLLKDLIDANKLGLDYEVSSEKLPGIAEAEYFISLGAKWDTRRKVQESCQKYPGGAFCRATGRLGFITDPNLGRRSKRVSRADRRRVGQLIEQRKFEQLPPSPEPMIAATSKWSKEKQLRWARQVSEVDKCLNSSVYFASAYNAEGSLPGQDTQKLIEGLYQKAVDCSKDEASARAAYRLGVFKLTVGQCRQAAPLFDRVVAEKGLRFLHSRSIYWAAKCRARDNGGTFQGVESLYLQFPLSFHGMMALEESGQDLMSRIRKNPEPLAVSRSADNQNWNQTLRAAEFLLSRGESKGAVQLIRSLNMDEIVPKSSKLALYVCYLLSRAEAGLLKFQALAIIFSAHPELKTPTTMKLFYPNWRFDLIKKYAEEAGLDPYLVMGLIRQESAFKTDAASRARAKGLMQVLPSTARTVDRRVTRQLLFDPEVNVRVGTQYLARVIRRFDGNIHLALAGYNAGSGIVDVWLRRYPTTDTAIMGDLIPFRETREYIGSVMRNYYWYKALYSGKTISVQAPKIPSEALEAAVSAPVDEAAASAVSAEEAKQVEEQKTEAGNGNGETPPTDAQSGEGTEVKSSTDEPSSEAEPLPAPLEESTPDI